MYEGHSARSKQQGDIMTQMNEECCRVFEEGKWAEVV
jgi:hypothetical protein